MKKNLFRELEYEGKVKLGIALLFFIFLCGCSFIPANPLFSSASL